MENLVTRSSDPDTLRGLDDGSDSVQFRQWCVQQAPKLCVKLHDACIIFPRHEHVPRPLQASLTDPDPDPTSDPSTLSLLVEYCEADNASFVREGHLMERLRFDVQHLSLVAGLTAMETVAAASRLGQRATRPEPPPSPGLGLGVGEGFAVAWDGPHLLVDRERLVRVLLERPQDFDRWMLSPRTRERPWMTIRVDAPQLRVRASKTTYDLLMQMIWENLQAPFRSYPSRSGARKLAERRWAAGVGEAAEDGVLAQSRLQSLRSFLSTQRVPYSEEAAPALSGLSDALRAVAALSEHWETQMDLLCEAGRATLCSKLLRRRADLSLPLSLPLPHLSPGPQPGRGRKAGARLGPAQLLRRAGYRRRRSQWPRAVTTASPVTASACGFCTTTLTPWCSRSPLWLPWGRPSSSLTPRGRPLLPTRPREVLVIR